jgi:hypothetical protein
VPPYTRARWPPRLRLTTADSCLPACLPACLLACPVHSGPRHQARRFQTHNPWPLDPTSSADSFVEIGYAGRDLSVFDIPFPAGHGLLGLYGTAHAKGLTSIGAYVIPRANNGHKSAAASAAAAGAAGDEKKGAGAAGADDANAFVPLPASDTIYHKTLGTRDVWTTAPRGFCRKSTAIPTIPVSGAGALDAADSTGGLGVAFAPYVTAVEMGFELRRVRLFGSRLPQPRIRGVELTLQATGPGAEDSEPLKVQLHKCSADAGSTFDASLQPGMAAHTALPSSFGLLMCVLTACSLPVVLPPSAQAST